MPPRHHEVTRLEGFSDAVFGFALTLLVVSLEVPNSVDELLTDLKGFVGFALMFAMVCWIWYEHNVFFRTGVVLIFSVFVLLYRHAWNKRKSLQLTEKEELSLKYGQRAHLISMGLGLSSLAIVLTTGQAGVAGIIYTLMGPLHAWNGYRAGKAHHQLEMRTTNT